MKKIFILILSLYFTNNTLAKVPPINLKKIEKKPKRIIRPCCAFGLDLKFKGLPFSDFTTITSVDKLGKHQFLGHKSENNGIIYTKKGGFIDIAHLRDCADWTAYLFNLLKHHNGTFLTKKIGNEAGLKTLKVDLRKKLSDKEILKISASIAHDLSLWHEISTWFGATTIFFFNEKFSSFSPEDQYSNLLGVLIGMQAIESREEYEKAMTKLIDEKLEELDAVETEEQTNSAFKEIDNLWWNSKKKLPSKKILIKRYITNNETLKPWLVDTTINGSSIQIPIKGNSYLKDLYSLEIKTNYHLKRKELENIGIKNTITNKDFIKLIAFIKEEIIAEY